MTEEQIKSRLEEKQTELASLEERHALFLNEMQKEIQANQIAYNQLQGAIAELKLMLPEDETSST